MSSTSALGVSRLTRSAIPAPGLDKIMNSRKRYTSDLRNARRLSRTRFHFPRVGDISSQLSSAWSVRVCMRTYIFMYGMLNEFGIDN